MSLYVLIEVIFNSRWTVTSVPSKPLSACRVLLCLQAFSQVLPRSALTQTGWSTRLIYMNWVRAAGSWGVPLFRLTEPYVCLRASPSRWPRASGTGRDESLPPNSGKQTLIRPLPCLLLKHPSCTGDFVRDEWITLNVSHWVSRAESNRAVFVEVAEHCVSWLKLWRALGGTAVCATSGTEQPSLGTENNQLFSPWVICRAAAHMTDSCTFPWADPVNILKWLCPEFKCDF